MTTGVKKCLQDAGYSTSYHEGKQAIKHEHREKIRVKDTHNIKGSMDIDEACKESEPHSPRWDYLVVVCKNRLENLALIEVHPAAKKGNMDEVIELTFFA